MFFLAISIINVIVIALILWRKSWRERIINKILHSNHDLNHRTILVFFIAFCIFTILLLTDAVVSMMGMKDVITTIKRPSFGAEKQVISLDVYGKYEKEEVKKNLNFTISPVKLTEKEKKQHIKQCMKKVSNEMLGKNKSIQEVQYPLTFRQKDIETGVSITWESLNQDLIDENGMVNTAFISVDQQASIKAEFEIDGVTEEKTYDFILIPNRDKEYIQDSIGRMVGEVMEEMRENSPYEDVALPHEIGNIIQLTFRESKENHGIVLILMWLISFFVIYKVRQGNVLKKERDRRERIINTFPDFINKLVMMLGAGLVIHGAMERIAFEYNQSNVEKGEKPLYEEISRMMDYIRESNASLTEELVFFGDRENIKEIKRFALIVSENMTKGSTLTEKLEREGELLWNGRKAKIAELGKLADTKLVFPLMMMLMVLIGIVIFPSISGM